ncbi:C6 transcription factor SndA, putative [Talaromyces stipitatus ATCC 10500]|uniref:C6 transcription factor SndA, putative n=1 Tax=Talaromyces stipitatus (strain ATCC 10500 / CBS 375.48 / QM 6759 / NRRL 1006) TaxID=441959 RepID=B8LYR8_TALSN|nr:C6 transcription factor SndA, putative [Talaromyces stipitatus ATCC 10500]XP_002340814.1 C6 transcription factor SndA, putative [Talaromyces stipitatus ATCC 10500]EED23426.1 C6 transcription factor SndA, putative [Talaromyces stipitatus ATCC 10500]EED23427.1 C6 transcription factor SndA, putative [Talaromyces stipitatus ATCC 10500]
MCCTLLFRSRPTSLRWDTWKSPTVESGICSISIESSLTCLEYSPFAFVKVGVRDGDKQHVAGQNYNTRQTFRLQFQSKTAMDNHPDRMRGYRLIAPRHVDVQKPPTPQSPNADEGKTKRASMACLECKKRRTKCSTGNPCTECHNHQRECVYDINADKRRKEHVISTKQQLENTEEALRYYRTFLEDILASMRLGSRSHVEQLVQVVQNTVRNPDPDDRSGYTTIRETIFSILSEFEDAEGSEEASDVDQNMTD